jgi:hypothetical protein
MEEYEVIIHVASYLIKKGWKIKNISVNKKDQRKKIKIALGLDDDGIFQKGEDIVATNYEGARKILIEAKGGTYKYGIYTALGQMVCRYDDTRRNWFGLAFPEEWRNPLQKRIKGNHVLRLIITDARKKHKSLIFYFVDENGKVYPKTWNQLLKS